MNLLERPSIALPPQPDYSEPSLPLAETEPELNTEYAHACIEEFLADMPKGEWNYRERIVRQIANHYDGAILPYLARGTLSAGTESKTRAILLGKVGEILAQPDDLPLFIDVLKARPELYMRTADASALLYLCEVIEKHVPHLSDNAVREELADFLCQAISVPTINQYIVQRFADLLAVVDPNCPIPPFTPRSHERARNDEEYLLSLETPVIEED